MTIQQTRKDHLKSLWAEGIWGKWVGLAWFVLTAFPFVRDEFWRPDDENRWKLINLVPHWSLPMWSAVTLALLLAWVYEASYRSSVKDKARLSTYEALSPIEIIFDTTNRQRRFWSLETVTKPDNTVSHNYYRYAVAIHNTGGRTLRDVQVVSELTGELRHSPSAGQFEMTKTQQTDLHPGDERLVTIFTWPYPAIQPGMAAGTSAKDWYGGVKVSVSATDMPVVTRTFDFDYTKEPMLFDPLPDGQNDPDAFNPFRVTRS
ncbi:hypothetical protein CY652_17830 [Burkholderia sp. WAC0059]|uniref:hypothetical protein n=1 Tax=Burkholderia sp. WAC0059 TaxID=2066022 RepID=UPI000C7F21B1|nr:hypothetical protein [Burkholderia sp. WAC0059]PLZ01142.1 hypothetical protein CY652_17830 [Burkholderia sp. WAC0059]